MNASSPKVLVAGLKPSTVGPLRRVLESIGQIEVSPQLRRAIERVRSERPALVVLPADRGAGLAACDRLRTDETLGQPIVWLLSEDGLTARVAAHWLRPTRAHLYGVLPLSPEFIAKEVVPLLPDAGELPTSPIAPVREPVRPEPLHSMPPAADESSDEYQRLRDRLSNTRRQLRALERTNAAVNSKLAETRDALATANADLARRHDELRQVGDAGLRDKHRVEELEDELDAIRHELDVERRRLTGEVLRLRESLSETRRTHQDSQARAARLERDTTARDAMQRERIEELEAQRNELSRKADSLRQREGELRQSLQLTRAAVDTDMRRREQEVGQLREALATAERVEKDFTEQLQLLQTDNATLRSAMVEAESRLAKHRSDSSERQTSLQAQLDEALAQLADTTQADQLRMAEDQLEALNQALVRAAESAGDVRRSLEADCALLGTKVDELSLEVDALKTERDTALQEVAAAAAAATEDHAQLQALRDDSERLRRERDAFESRQTELVAKASQLESERDSLQSAHTDMTRERDGLRADRDDLVGVRTRLRARLDTAEQKREELRLQLDDARLELDQEAAAARALRRERDALRTERNRLAEEHLPLVEERNRLRDELGPIKADAEQFSIQLAATRAQLVELRKELEAERERSLILELTMEDMEPPTDSGDGQPSPAWQRLHREYKEKTDRLSGELQEHRERVDELVRELDRTKAQRRETERRLAAAELEAGEARTQQVQDLDWFMETLRAIRGPRS